MNNFCKNFDYYSQNIIFNPKTKEDEEFNSELNEECQKDNNGWWLSHYFNI